MLLLDSHVAVWALDDSPRLGPVARRAIIGATGVYVSAASIWELTIKSALGKIDIPAGLSAVLVSAGYLPLNVTAEHAESIFDHPEMIKHDPFDRLLVSQAHRAGLRLLTADRMLLSLNRDFITDATV
ncbi:MAG: type II toxin-antitoxin system VapC family toxin [Actinomycetota bacterium]|nr:type II toxin-antitoxin system VapC family toxin [Actinomycetota bacterium]